MIEKQLDNTIEEMRRMAEMLMPYTYPNAPPSSDVRWWKVRNFDVDGYSLSVCFSISDYGQYRIETLVLCSQTALFLPFTVVLKVAKKFLGGHYLNFMEMQSGKKNYYWTVYLDNRGRPIPPPDSSTSEVCKFEGFEYFVPSKSVNFF